MSFQYNQLMGSGVIKNPTWHLFCYAHEKFGLDVGDLKSAKIVHTHGEEEMLVPREKRKKCWNSNGKDYVIRINLRKYYFWTLGVKTNWSEKWRNDINEIGQTIT